MPAEKVGRAPAVEGESEGGVPAAKEKRGLRRKEWCTGPASEKPSKQKLWGAGRGSGESTWGAGGRSWSGCGGV